MKLEKAQKQALAKFAGQTWKDKTPKEWLNAIGLAESDMDNTIKGTIQDFLRKLKAGIGCCYLTGKQRITLSDSIVYSKDANKKRSE